MKELDKIYFNCASKRGYLYHLQDGVFIKSRYVYYSPTPCDTKKIKEVSCKMIGDRDWDLIKLTCTLIKQIEEQRVPLEVLHKFESPDFKTIINCLNYTELSINLVAGWSNFTLDYKQGLPQVSHFCHNSIHYIGQSAQIVGNTIWIKAKELLNSNEVTLRFDYSDLGRTIYYFWGVYALLKFNPITNLTLFLRSDIGQPLPYTTYSKCSLPEFLHHPATPINHKGYINELKNLNCVR